MRCQCDVGSCLIADTHMFINSSNESMLMNKCIPRVCPYTSAYLEYVHEQVRTESYAHAQVHTESMPMNKCIPRVCP